MQTITQFVCLPAFPHVLSILYHIILYRIGHIV